MKQFDDNASMFTSERCSKRVSEHSNEESRKQA
jgi:hypothetical protein